MSYRYTKLENPISRRGFIKASAAVSLSALGAGAGNVFAAGSDKVRVGLIGCGGRGLYDSTNCVNSVAIVRHGLLVTKPNCGKRRELKP